MTASDNGSLTQFRIFNAEGPHFNVIFLMACHLQLILSLQQTQSIVSRTKGNCSHRMDSRVMDSELDSEWILRQPGEKGLLCLLAFFFSSFKQWREVTRMLSGQTNGTNTQLCPMSYEYLSTSGVPPQLNGEV